MTPFVEADTTKEFHDPRMYMERFGFSYEQAVNAVSQMKTERYYLNDIYQVHVSDVHRGVGWPDFIHLSIKRTNTVRVMHNGVLTPMTKVCRELGLNYKAVMARIYKGCTPEEAICRF